MNPFLGNGAHLWGPAFFLGLAPLILILVIVVIFLKGYALWTSARRGETWWFIVMLVINTAGILELIYLIGFAKVWPKRKNVPPAGHPNGQSPSTDKGTGPDQGSNAPKA